MENKYSTEEYKKIKDKEREELKNTLNQGIKDALNSERYKSFLNIMSRCHNYSFTNSLLISLQNENATLVKSFTDWKKDGVKMVHTIRAEIDSGVLLCIMVGIIFSTY